MMKWNGTYVCTIHGVVGVSWYIVLVVQGDMDVIWT